MSSDLLILGTDTDAGKTTFCLLFLSRFGGQFDYWKPLASGTSDAETVSRLVPGATVHPPVLHFAEPVAPLLAANLAGVEIPSAVDLAARKPLSQNRLLIESFGSPFSPLNPSELQVEFLHRLAIPSVLVSSSRLGAIGRTLQTLRALAGEGIEPEAVILIGEYDSFACWQISRYWKHGPVWSFNQPEAWTPEGIARAAEFHDHTWPEVANHLCRPRRDPGVKRLLRELDRESVWHPYTPLRGADDPLIIESAHEEFLYLADGRKIIDGISSWWTIQHGHRFPPLMRALHDTSAKLDHVIFAGVTHAPAVELAQLLLTTMPWSDGRVFYSDNGSTAVEVALKMCYQFWCHRGEPQRKLFIGFENGYHGDTFGAMSVGRDPLFFGHFEPLLFRAVQIPVSEDALERALSDHSGEVAGVILEPLVQGAGGMKMHAPETLLNLFEICRRHGIPFIADEVMTGGGRTGTRWAFEQAGIAPELVCAGKTLAGGILPLSATLVSPRIREAFDSDDRRKTFFHGHSFTANPLACAVGVANFREMESGRWREQVLEMERFWENASREWEALPGVREVRIRGSIAAIEMDGSGGYLAEVGTRMRRTALAEGVLLRPLGNVLYAMPPYRTSAGSLDRIAAAMARAVSAAVTA